LLRRALTPQELRVYRRVAETPWETRATLDLNRLDVGIEALVARVEDDEAAALIRSEVARWATCFAPLVDQRHVEAQLSSVTSDMCRKFHTDWVSLRLLCTLVGPATEWLRDEDVDRQSLGRFDLGLDEANRAVLRSGASIQHAMPGDVVLLKGDAWPGNEGKGAVHRSPPVESSGERRLLLKLDAARCGC
ncbi:MAG: DUF1826 domain-containing protein, partial [Myxococcota bacterium]